MKNKIMALMAAVLVTGFAASAGADGAVNTQVVTPTVSTSVAVEAANLYASGMSYYNGTNGVKQDWLQAREQLTAAAHKGSDAAMSQLVTMYNFGYGGPANPALAAYWGARAQRAVVNANAVINVNNVSGGAVVGGTVDNVSAGTGSADAVSGDAINNTGVVGDAANPTNNVYSAE